ncbi:MAG: hypothetical protein NTZ55_03755 [Candidatus Roizmanbacteria bacterium]|nr:hypothetical protein [Candidatus Roizmanbacteria bacterium]
MTKKPYINAILAVLYILVVSFILYFGTILKFGNNSVLAPAALISLFTFSAVTMGYLFFYQPFVLYFDGKKKQSLHLFLHTLFIFGCITIAFFIFLFLTSIGKK